MTFNRFIYILLISPMWKPARSRFRVKWITIKKFSWLRADLYSADLYQLSAKLYSISNAWGIAKLNLQKLKNRSVSKPFLVLHFLEELPYLHLSPSLHAIIKNNWLLMQNMFESILIHILSYNSIIYIQYCFYNIKSTIKI
jgi:hypothetical protein